jgi:hypothetical protein
VAGVVDINVVVPSYSTGLAFFARLLVSTFCYKYSLTFNVPRFIPRQHMNDIDIDKMLCDFEVLKRSYKDISEEIIIASISLAKFLAPSSFFQKFFKGHKSRESKTFYEALLFFLFHYKGLFEQINKSDFTALLSQTEDSLEDLIDPSYDSIKIILKLSHDIHYQARDYSKCKHFTPSDTENYKGTTLWEFSKFLSVFLYGDSGAGINNIYKIMDLMVRSIKLMGQNIESQ